MHLSHCVPCSYEEAGRYLETYKAYENKPPDLLMERVDSDFTSRVRPQMCMITLIYFVCLYLHVENCPHNYVALFPDPHPHPPQLNIS